MVTGMDNTKIKKKHYKNLIERDTELLQGAYFGGKPEHVIEENKKRRKKNNKQKKFKLFYLLFITFFCLQKCLIGHLLQNGDIGTHIDWPN